MERGGHEAFASTKRSTPTSVATPCGNNDPTKSSVVMPPEPDNAATIPAQVSEKNRKDSNGVQ